VLLLAAALATAATPSGAPPCTVDRATGTTIDPGFLLQDGYLTRWNAAINRVAYMAPGTDGYYRIFTMQPDGSDRRPLTANLDRIPTKHQGMPYWHPSGRYLVFAAQKQEWHSPRLFGNPDYEAVPGFGLHDDLWLITADGTQAWRLTQDPNARTQGMLMPVFSPDGRYLAWSERQADKTYEIRVADFVESPEPHLANIRSYAPGGRAYYEPGSFTSDSRSLTYSSDQDTHSFWHSQIYRLDLDSGKSIRLTQGTAYGEHPTVVATPDGDWVIYMTIRGVDHYPHHLMLGTDWYAMRVDGSGTKRLTTMNVNRSDNPQNSGEPQVAITVAVSPGGEYLLGDVQDDLARQTGRVHVVRFVCR
jgi:Tol biopolymer transport system component